MAKVLQHRRGTTAEHANFTGAAGEVTVDTTDKRLVVHDGSTKGGVPAAKKSEIVDAKSELQQAINNAVAEIGGTIDTIEGSIAELRKHNVGEEWVSYSGVIPQGGVPYLGQEVSREMYADLWQWAKDNRLVTSEAQWQSNLARDNGNVRQFSNGDGSTTFRMPRIVGYVKGASSLDEAGSYIKEGLPNITGTLGYLHRDASLTGYDGSSGALKWANINTAVSGGDNATRYGYDIDFNASRSNSIYGNSSHVTPETSVVLFGVYAFGEVTNAGSVDVQNVANAIARVETSYLPLSGGTLTGTIDAPYLLAKKSTDDSELNIYGSSAENHGGRLVLFGQDSQWSNGGFVLIATNSRSGQWVQLSGEPDGMLTWGGLRVDVVDYWRAGINWYRKYSDGFIEQGGFHSDTSGSGTDWRTCTLHTPFTTVDYHVSRSFVAVGGNDAGSVHPFGFGVRSKTTSSYVYSYPVSWSGWAETWYACGY